MCSLIVRADTSVPPPAAKSTMHGLIKVIPQDELLTVGKFLILIGIILPGAQLFASSETVSPVASVIWWHDRPFRAFPRMRSDAREYP
jgi:hypothetical protein